MKNPLRYKKHSSVGYGSLSAVSSGNQGVAFGFKNIPKTPKNLFSNCVNYFSNEGISLYKQLKGKGYTRKDLLELILIFYDVEEFMGMFVGDNNSEVFEATKVFEHLEKSLESPRLPKGVKSDLVIDYGREKKTEEEFLEVLGVPLKKLPLFVNGSEFQKVIVKWRLKINK